MIINPFFEEAIKKEEIRFNPCKHLKYDKVEKKDKIEKRVITDKLEIAKILYKSIKDYRARYIYQRDELNVFFLMLLLTGHRQNEVI